MCLVCADVLVAGAAAASSHFKDIKTLTVYHHSWLWTYRPSVLPVMLWCSVSTHLLMMPAANVLGPLCGWCIRVVCVCHTQITAPGARVICLLVVCCVLQLLQLLCWPAAAQTPGNLLQTSEPQSQQGVLLRSQHKTNCYTSPSALVEILVASLRNSIDAPAGGATAQQQVLCCD